GHDRWVVDVRGMTSLAHRFDQNSAGAMLGNGVSGDQVLTFVLQQGQVLVVPSDLGGATTPWLSLGDGHNILRPRASVPEPPAPSEAACCYEPPSSPGAADACRTCGLRGLRR